MFFKKSREYLEINMISHESRDFHWIQITKPSVHVRSGVPIPLDRAPTYNSESSRSDSTSNFNSTRVVRVQKFGPPLLTVEYHIPM